MKAPTTTVVLALLVSLAGLSYLLTAGTSSKTEPVIGTEPTGAVPASPEPGFDATVTGNGLGNVSEKVIAYYFHGTIRCPSCLDIERYSRQTIYDSFFQELYDGSLEWRSVDYDLPRGAHFSTDYHLSLPSLVLVKFKGDQQVDWKVLGKTWEFVRDTDALVSYVRDELLVFLAEDT